MLRSYLLLAAMLVLCTPLLVQANTRTQTVITFPDAVYNPNLTPPIDTREPSGDMIACSQDVDCTLEKDQCDMPVAVNITHSSLYQAAVRKQDDDSCAPGEKPSSFKYEAICQGGMCARHEK